jgi:cbb3-type cytochrome oxidase maturation protein
MSVIILLLVASLSVATLFLGAFIWNVRHNQFDDEFSPPRRILFEDTVTDIQNDTSKNKIDKQN